MRDLPNGRLYYSELGLFEFQEMGVAQAALNGDRLAVWDTGIGKTHLAMALSSILFEDDLIDTVLVVCESNKMAEWVADYTKFTALDATLYHGTKRAKVNKDDFHIFVTTFETAKTEMCSATKPPGKRGVHLDDGPLLPWLVARRMLVVYDESTKLKHRSSGLWKAHEYGVNAMRAGAGCRVLGLSATPYETTPEDIYNQLRIINPGVLPRTIGEFERYYTSGRDDYGRLQFKPQLLHEFFRMISPALMRKRKTDPDVINQFPEQMEESLRVPLSGPHREFYEVVEGLRDVLPDTLPGAHWTTLRMVAAYPESLLLTKANREERDLDPAVLAKLIVDTVGEAGLKAIKPSKMSAMTDWLDLVVTKQRAKVVIFTYFGPTVAPLIARDLREAGFRVYSHHPPMTAAAMEIAKQQFKSSVDPCVLISSDGGSKGINLPEAMYVFHYDLPTRFSTYRQRSDRNHRIDSKLPSVTSMACILEDTVEEDIAITCMDRNAVNDIIVGDGLNAHENHILAGQRREMLAIGTKKRRRNG